MTKAPKPGDGKVRAARLAELPTHLLHRALQLALDLHGQASGPAAITQRQHTVLAGAAASEGQTQNDLVRATGIDRSTLADLVARMLTKGLLERRRSVTDARANTVRLSQAGRAALAESVAAAEAADARLLSFLPGKKRQSFVKALGLLAAAADGGQAIDSRPAARDGSSEPSKPPKAEKKKKRKKAKRD